MVNTLIEMGFARPVARIAVERCENYDSSRPPDENLDVLLNWILDHPNAVADEEKRLAVISRSCVLYSLSVLYRYTGK